MNTGPFSYFDYESKIRLKDPDIIRSHREHLAHFVQYFRGCKHVLDIACGEGIFLDLLKSVGISASGLDANAEVVRDAISKGHRVFESDVLEYLESTRERFDGILCSHLIEHLPFEGVLRLIQGVSNCLLPGGVFVLAFPNPRALRTHLNQFWVDPQHVRFYDSSLIEGVLKWSGFDVLHNSDNFTESSESYRFAPRDLLDKLSQIERPTNSLGKLEWLRCSDDGMSRRLGIWNQLVQWFRKRLGIALLATELLKVNRLLAETVHMLEDCDMEVRLVGRKSA